MKITNSMSGKKEEFVPLKKGEVKMYACGITVYDLSHIGHARQAIDYAMITDYLRYRGYHVTYVRNYTDVDDKIIKRANELGRDALEFSAEQIRETEKDMAALHVTDADINTKASEYIPQIIKVVEGLIKKGHAYVTEKGDVYFSVKTDKNYGKLSHRKVEELRNGVRIEVDEEKEDPVDFALWKSAKPGEIYWESPWGKGRPGWHIECSAMALDTLGETIDIHGGGRDLIFPHHENEIAQSKGLTGKIPAKTWMHVEFLQVDGGKMSKSLGNTYILDQLQEKGIEPLAYKLFCFTAHYRTKLNFTFDTALATQKALTRLREGFVKHQQGTENIDEQEIKEYENKFLETINDDLNMPAAMGIVWEIVRNEHKSNHFAELLLKFDKVLGLDLENSKKYLEESKNVELPEDIQDLIEKRKEARENKDWSLSDQIRDELKEKGYIVKDTKEGMTIEKV